MTVIVAIVSQKGGVGKSTITRALAQQACKSGLSVKVADLDTQQGTVYDWHQKRLQRGYGSIGSVDIYNNVKSAFYDIDDYDILIIDSPARSSKGTLKSAQKSDLVIQPTGTCEDDLKPSVLLFHELVKEGIPKEKLYFTLNRVVTKNETREAKEYIHDAGYSVFKGALPNQTAYRDAHNKGLSICETKYKTLNKKANKLINSITSFLIKNV